MPNSPRLPPGSLMSRLGPYGQAAMGPAHKFNKVSWATSATTVASPPRHSRGHRPCRDGTRHESAGPARAARSVRGTGPPLNELEQPGQHLVRLAGVSQQLGQLADDDDDGDPVEVAGQDRLREQAREEVEAAEPGREVE